MNRIHPCERLFVDSCCSLHVCTSLVSSALVTDAPTLALAQVLEEMQSVSLHYRLSILRLVIALGQQKPFTSTKNNLESTVVPTEFLTANLVSQTDAEAQRKLFCEDDQKFAELPAQQKLTKLCSNAGFSKNLHCT